MSGADSPSVIENLEVLEIQVSRNQEEANTSQISPLAAENMFSAIHGMLRDDPDVQEHFSFEIASSGKDGIRFYVALPSHTLKFIEGQIYAHYPTAQIKVVEDYAPKFHTENKFFEFVSVLLTRDDFFPIKSFRDLETDTLSSFTSAIASIGEEDEIWIQVQAKPVADVWQKEGQAFVKAVRAGETPGQKSKNTVVSGILTLMMKEALQIATDVFAGALTYKARTFDEQKPGYGRVPEVRITATQELELRTIENKLSRMGYDVQMRIMSSGPTKDRVESHLRSVLATLKQFSSATLNNFTSVLESNKMEALQSYIVRRFEPDKSFILNTEELGTIYHLPTSNIETPNISWVYSRKSEPPTNLPTENCNYIGHTTYRNKQVMFGLDNGDDRLRHMYLIGKSGTGKSTLLETMISQDIANGAGVGVLDPHGETIDRVLDRIPEHRIKDVIYFDPSDTDRPLGLNLLEMNDPSEKNLMASGLVSAIKQHFEYSWGPRLEYLLNYAILTLLEVPGTTLLGITRLMDDPNYQKYILHQIKDPLVIRFWEREFKEMKGNQKLVTEAIAPIQNKVNRFLASTTIRNILGQKKSTLDLWDAMNSGKILLMNLSKGKIGADNANLLGALLVSRLQFFALQRAKIPYDQRRPFYLYVDEFQNFATGSFEEILSESRKYKLGLYLTHQFTAQLPETLLKAVFGNVGTIATFSLGAPDAKALSSEFAPYFDSEDIISLERFYVYIKLMINGMTSLPFSARILVPWEDKNFIVPKTTNREAVIKYSRETYGVESGYIEAKINKWLETQFDKGMAIAQEIKNKAETAPQEPVQTEVQPENLQGDIN
ncbi:hypothetical protein A2415_03745 [candidate division WWE3 bacterium RIFOXYC1_FULL_39_7]|uniref:Uncharacterized protein n=2 Tax=Katanobacteria TaxID=422282 RepID=A0A1F4X3L2_UNCKA|nr:MAG: hypothetical protein A2415_03745 [candidate division WWE3 bacterium RIFOXYC1_FULL_39_7]OGC76196.1 MAG: hypothetical protein A2619_01255 [candidate division WWE3 bacterium RIFOXYD1_FULL_39_9]